MKRNLYALTVTLALLTFTPGINAQNVLIKSIEYDVPIYNEASCLGPIQGPVWWKNNLEPSSRWYIENSLIGKAKKGSISVYTNEGKLMRTDEIWKSLWLSIDTIALTRAEPPHDTYDTIIPFELTPDEIQFIRFRETWSYDSKSFSIKKAISEYAPVYKLNLNNPDSSYDPENVKYVPLFWIKCNPKNSSTKNFITLSGFVESNCKIVNRYINYHEMYNLISVSDDSLGRETYLKDLFRSAQGGSMNIYKPYDVIDYLLYYKDKLEPASANECADLFDHTDTMMFQRPDPPYDEYDSVVRQTLDPKTCGLFRFQEKWLINPSTMEIKKEVISFTPAQIVFDENYELKGFKPLFTIFFSKLNRFFSE